MRFLTISSLLFTAILIFTERSEMYDEATVAEDKGVARSYLVT